MTTWQSESRPFLLSANRLMGVRSWCHRLALCGVVIVPLLATEARAECKSEEGLCMLIALERNELSIPDLEATGADVLGVSGGRVHARVSEAIINDLTSRGIGYELISSDIYEAYQKEREMRVVPRAERFVDYHDFEATVAAMRRVADNHPDLAAMRVIGQSLEGRSIYALRISDNAKTVELDEPAMLVVGCHHAREWISVEVPLYLADYLVENYLKDGDATRLVNYTEIWIVPVLNPDGFVYSWVTDRWWRKNRRSNDDGTTGIDPNRNYPIGFGGAGSSGYTTFETYRGPYPFSEPETRVMRDLLTGSFGRTFASTISYHNYSQLVMYPNAYTAAPAVNAAYYAELTGEMARLINRAHSNPAYDYVAQQSAQLYPSGGDFADWAHHELGMAAITVEVRPAGPPFFELPEDEIIPTCRENLPAFLYMAEQTMIPEVRLYDGDLDGFVNAEDYCPHTPSGAAVDLTGCASTEQDLDDDGVENALDACPDSLPGQQVDAEGCRAETLATVVIRSNIPSVEIDVAPVDIDAAGSGDTASAGFAREYAGETTVVLTAPEVVLGRRFSRWILDGEPQLAGQRGVMVLAAADADAEAVYVVPERVEIVGPTRIPDRREDGLDFVATYSASIVFSDSAVQPADKVIGWSLSDTSVALVTPDGELVTYDVSADEGEVATALTVRVESEGTELSSEPLLVSIFDADTVEPRCCEIVVEGVERVSSGSVHHYSASVRLDGDAMVRARSDSVEWRVLWSDPDVALPVPASVSSGGMLTAGGVETDTQIVVQASFVNDDDSACVVTKQVTIAAGEASELSAERILDGGTAMCGTVGMISLFGMFVGLIGLRISRR